MTNKSQETPITIGEELKDLRSKKHETQEQVAKAIGVRKSTICNYEKIDDFQVCGRREITNFLNLAKHFGLPENHFIDNSIEADSVEAVDNSNKISEHHPSDDLIEYFEELISLYRIDKFICCDFTCDTLPQEEYFKVLSFLDISKKALPKYRKEAHIANYIDFVNILTYYVDLLGTYMTFSENGESFRRLRNIDMQQFQNSANAYRAKLNEIYGLISNGGSFALFRT